MRIAWFRVSAFGLAVAAFAAALLLAAPAMAQGSDAELAKYPGPPVYTGKLAAVNLASHKDARTFRTRLREAAKERPNFAGHMIVTTWGCGASCQAVALIDARNGKVYFGPTASAGVKHRADSRLLIVNPPEMLKEAYDGKPPEGVAPEYYLWDKARLTKIRLTR